MMYIIWLIASFSVFVSFSAFALWMSFRPHKKRKLLRPLNIMLAGTFISAACIYVPYSFSLFFQDDLLSVLEVLFACAHNSVKLFIIDSDYGEIQKFTELLPIAVRVSYRIFSGVLFFVAPVLTVSTALSFLEHVSASNKYLTSYFKDVYVLSEMNERSVCLAKSLRLEYPSSVIAFTDVYEKDDEAYCDMIEEVKELGACIFKKDITSCDFSRHSKNTKMYFFIIGEDKDENVDHALKLSAPRDKWWKTTVGARRGYDYPGGDKRIYLFSGPESCEKQLSMMEPEHLKIRRVNDVQSLIYHMLYKKGGEIFSSAVDTGSKIYNIATDTEDSEKKISALVVGMGHHGTELVKALSWFCQMHPYRLEINAFDVSTDVSQRFMLECPELFDRDPVNGSESPACDGTRYHNGDFETPGDAHYKISIYEGYDVRASSFYSKLKELGDVTYVVVALGNDDQNIKTSIELRTFFTRQGIAPSIHTIVYNSNNYDMLKENFRRDESKGSFKIEPFGNIEEMYSISIIANTELEEQALERHLEYTMQMIEQKERELAEKNETLSEEEKQRDIAIAVEQFWNVDYNYRSSVASVLHTHHKKQLDLPGSRKAKEDRTENEKWFYRRIEHSRWNAYMRSEGYVYGPVRNKTAKIHHLLTPFDDLPQKERVKDDY